MSNAEAICDELRVGIRLSPGAHISPYVLVRMWKLRLCPVSPGQPGRPARPGLGADDTIYFDDTVSPAEQDYQIARFAWAWALRRAGWLAEASPHDVCINMCGVEPPPPMPAQRSLVAPPPRAERARVVSLASRRRTRFRRY